jgi:hypothetical protein
LAALLNKPQANKRKTVWDTRCKFESVIKMDLEKTDFDNVD